MIMALTAAQSGLTVEERLTSRSCRDLLLVVLDTATPRLSSVRRAAWSGRSISRRRATPAATKSARRCPNLWYRRPHAFMGREHHPHNFLLRRDGDRILSRSGNAFGDQRLDQTDKASMSSCWCIGT